MILRLDEVKDRDPAVVVVDEITEAGSVHEVELNFDQVLLDLWQKIRWGYWGG